MKESFYIHIHIDFDYIIIYTATRICFPRALASLHTFKCKCELAYDSMSILCLHEDRAIYKKRERVERIKIELSIKRERKSRENADRVIYNIKRERERVERIYIKNFLFYLTNSYCLILNISKRHNCCLSDSKSRVLALDSIE